MYRNAEGIGWRRAGAGLATAVIHALFAALLIWGLATDRGARDPDGVTVAAFDVSPPPPPPPPEPERAARESAPAEPAPEGRTGRALPREAPETTLALAPRPAAPSAGEGGETSDGSGARGAGSGAGGAGAGGGGGGGIATPARRIAGALHDSDYPRAAEAARMAGTVGISFRVRSDGRVDRCTVVRSSGHPLLDDLTCRLFTERYRFRPATTAAGRPVESTLQTSFTWGTRRR